jgi:hypothetical protein
MPSGRISGRPLKSSTWTSGNLHAPLLNALYYPFHLCHDRTLQRLLTEFQSVHFRDYMALRLNAMAGTVAMHDRMGDQHPDLVRTGRIVQGYDVSGRLTGEVRATVDRDLGDPGWRAIFHEGLREDRRFQRGLFDLSHSMTIGGRAVPGPAALLRLLEDRRASEPWTVVRVEQLAGRTLAEPDAYDYEYGLALIKTAAALAQTIRLAREHRLTPVTDSPVHRTLLRRTCEREGLQIADRYLTRDGY